MLTLNEVREAGNIGFLDILFGEHLDIQLSIIIGCIIAIGYVAIATILDTRKWKFFDMEDLIANGGGALFILLLTFIIVIGLYPNAHEQEVNEWEEAYAIPYIEQQEQQESEVLYIKVDPEIETDIGGGWLAISTTHEYLTPLTIAFKDDQEVRNVTQWFSSSMTLTDEEIPYVTYREIDHDLGNGIDKGVYNATVFLPENYTFTDIK